MFFPRLRTHAKFMFVFLALVFGVGFVVFGVGSSLPSGVADILRNSGSSNLASIKDAQKKVDENPKDASAQLELSQAYQRNGDIDKAIAALKKYTQLRPKDVDQLQTLAGLYTTQGGRAQQDAQIANAQYLAASGVSSFAPTNLFQNGPLDQAVLDKASKASSEASAKGTSAYRNAAAAYGKITKLHPRQAENWFLLGLAAESANDTKLALTGYRKFLQLSPDASESAAVKQKIQQLEQSQRAPVSSSGATATTR
jgi:cytochrome c-type biogenesis protein CcmH/NrfG